MARWSDKYDFGYPLVGDVSSKGFSCSLLDKVGVNSGILPKYGGKVNYIAIGKK